METGKKITLPKLGGRYIAGNNAPIEESLRKFGQILKSKRIQKNATQKDLAAHSGVSVDTIKRGESGRSISTEKLLQIMRSLEMLPALMDAYKEPEISLEDEWLLKQKKAKTKRQRVRGKNGTA